MTGVRVVQEPNPVRPRCAAGAYTAGMHTTAMKRIIAIVLAGVMALTAAGLATAPSADAQPTSSKVAVTSIASGTDGGDISNAGADGIGSCVRHCIPGDPCIGRPSAAPCFPMPGCIGRPSFCFPAPSPNHM